MSTGAILLADILPTLCLNTFMPFFLHRFPFDVRHGFICLAQAASYFIVAFSVNVPMSLFGVVVGALASGLGGMNFMALSSHFSKQAYSSGTGGAGVVGSFAYAGLTEPHMANLSPKDALLIMLIVPIVFAITYWFILDHPSTIHKVSIFKPSTWIVPKPKDISEKSSVHSLNSSISNDLHDISETNSTKLKNLTFIEKLKLVRPLLKYMIPLGLVYVGEYLINQGLTINAILFLFNAIYMFIPHIWIVFILIFYEGLLGGASYVNTFSRIHEEAKPEVREYCMAFAGFADAAGIALAGFTAIPVHNFICHHNVLS